MRSGSFNRRSSLFPLPPRGNSRQFDGTETDRRTLSILPPPDRSRNRMVRNPSSLLDLAQALRRGTDELDAATARDVKHIGGGVELTELTEGEVKVSRRRKGRKGEERKEKTHR